MTAFDFEPEDAYDAGDPPLARARNIARRLRLIDGRADPAGNDLGALIVELEGRIAAAYTAGTLTDPARRRLELAALHVVILRAGR